MTEAEAVELLGKLIETAELDAQTRTILIPELPSRLGGPVAPKRFASLRMLALDLESLVYDQLAYFPAEFDAAGEPQVDDGPRHVVNQVLQQTWVPAFLQSPDSRDVEDRSLERGPASSGSLLVGLEDLADASQLPDIQVDLEAVNEELVRYLTLHPERMYDLQPTTFESLVAELFRSMGYEVVVTPRTKDGGKDLKAYRKEPFGTLLTLVECKRYSRSHKVGVEIVRALYGVVGLEGASHGVVATTAFFTKDAKALQEQIGYRLSLADYTDLQAWCRQYKTGGRRRT